MSVLNIVLEFLDKISTVTTGSTLPVTAVKPEHHVFDGSRSTVGDSGSSIVVPYISKTVQKLISYIPS